jgi:hypothetical protein
MCFGQKQAQQGRHSTCLHEQGIVGLPGAFGSDNRSVVQLILLVDIERLDLQPV